MNCCSSGLVRSMFIVYDTGRISDYVSRLNVATIYIQQPTTGLSVCLSVIIGLFLIIMCTSHTIGLFSFTLLPLSSDRQHLSYDVCLEVRGEIVRTVLFCIVY